MSKKAKQLGYLSAIIISIGSTIGAGIFFKNGSIFNNVGGSLGLMITSWLVAGIGVLALGLALVELSSSSKRDGGILEWAKRFMPKRMAKMSASYMLLVYLPLNYLAMPLYVVNSLQDAIQSIDSSVEFNGGVTALMAFGLFFFTACLDWIRHSASEKMQIVISWSKFIPLAIVIGFGIYATSDTGVHTHVAGASASSITAFNPSLGILASIPAILFAYDGFYAITSLRSDLKEPKKLGSIIVLAISIITAAYLVFGIITGMTGQSYSHFIGTPWVLMVVNAFIMIAVFAILNSFAMITYRMYEDVYKEQPIGIVGLIAKWFKINNIRKAAFASSVFLTVIFYIILVPVGILGFGEGDYTGYGAGSGNLYNMADMLTNYTSLMVFLIIVGGVIGGMVNRRTNKIKVEKKWYFIPAAVIASVFALVGGLYMVIDNIAGMTGLNGADVKTEITKFVILIITLAMATVPAFISDKTVKKVSIKETKTINAKEA